MFRSQFMTRYVNQIIVYPSILGGFVGSAVGSYYGFTSSRRFPLVENIIGTTGGVFIGSLLGMGISSLWPISIPVIIIRYIFPIDT